MERRAGRHTPGATRRSAEGAARWVGTSSLWFTHLLRFGVNFAWTCQREESDYTLVLSKVLGSWLERWTRGWDGFFSKDETNVRDRRKKRESAVGRTQGNGIEKQKLKSGGVRAWIWGTLCKDSPVRTSTSHQQREIRSKTGH